jgi:hypothetical protein
MVQSKVRSLSPILLLALASLSRPEQLPAQQPRVIHGQVLSQTDSAPVAEALVSPLDVAGATVSSGTSGEFTLRLPPTVSRLLAVRIGFAPETVTVAGQDTVSIRLRPAPLTLDPITVAAEPVYSAASSRAIREFDIALRPRETSQELLRLAPGLVIAQHAGGGKAEQIFLRGFDADHGTDVAISVDGTPVNLVSHAHGQGYADLHFLMPEVVEIGEVRKGPYDAQDGDFATAGAVSFKTKDRITGPVVAGRGGSFNTLHGLAMVPFGGGIGHPGGFAALSAHYTDGPFVDPQGYSRVNGFAKFTAPVGRDAELVTSASGFESRWNASGEIPSRAVARGVIPRFGSLDPSEGGNTHRYDLSLGLRSRGAAERTWDIRAYVVNYNFQLWSNFTFFLVDSVNGDEIEQRDRDRYVVGLNGSFATPSRIVGLPGKTSIGIGGRADFADVELNHVVARTPLEPLTRSWVRQQQGSVWIRQELRLDSRLRLQLGLRGDLFHFEVADRLSSAAAVNATRPAGARATAVLSPKANVAFQVTPSTTLFANAGFGFHSNDARDVMLSGPGDQVLPRAVAAELGTRYVWRGGSMAASLWGIDLQSELIWVGDEGTTEASGRTRRLGIDFEGRVQLAPWLWADADLNLSRGRFGDDPRGANFVPLAPTFTSTGGLTVRDVGPVSGGLRYRHVGGRPADEANEVRARGYTLVETFASCPVGALDLTLAIDNLLDAQWNEAQFATTSRLKGEPSGITELNFTPGAGRSVQVGIGYRF